MTTACTGWWRLAAGSTWSAPMPGLAHWADACDSCLSAPHGAAGAAAWRPGSPPMQRRPNGAAVAACTVPATW
eukprot:354448-Chlamydomonas_euryale.AAC.6